MEAKIKSVEVIERARPRMEYETYSNGRQKPLQRLYNRQMTEFKQTTRVYVFPSYYSVMENLSGRRERPWQEWKPIIEAELRDAGYKGKVRWNQKAGCSCGCSPGFILDDNLDREDPVNVYIKLK
jgi:hypothetical protein